ncbi:glutaredoxin family protein [Zafaria sp. Z1313]|uniref:glutaredoxin family protein n=1 Tax=unclassified Zafaria TaxID=2828765 RepID=UPI002E7799A9|nr:glutaredoxin family protein [Zafaria sp. J156]MEE1621324.1 glutaredoxin family protein [Zafaria sp. J156]
MEARAEAPVVELLTREGCHLCAAARATLDEVCGRLGVPWTERGIDDDPELRHRFGEEVPVLMIDGVQRDFWVIDPARLAGLLGA